MSSFKWKQMFKKEKWHTHPLCPLTRSQNTLWTCASIYCQQSIHSFPLSACLLLVSPPRSPTAGCAVVSWGITGGIGNRNMLLLVWLWHLMFLLTWNVETLLFHIILLWKSTYPFLHFILLFMILCLTWSQVSFPKVINVFWYFRDPPVYQ